MKNNKKLIIILIVLSIGVLFCASLIVYKHSFNNIPENIIDIDDCTNKDCDKNKNDNKKDDNNKKQDDSKNQNNNSNNNNSNNNGNNSNINPSSGPGTNSNGTSNGSGNGSSNGSGTSIDGQGSGSGSGSGSSSGSGSGEGSGSGDGQGSGSGSGSGGGSGSGEGEGSGSGSGEGTTPSETPAEKVVVNDKDTTWENTTDLKIFDVDEIKPGDSGNYEFAVNNNTNGNIVYNLSFIEHNQYSVNLLYKLKLNDKYIAGDDDNWVSYNELNLKDKVLEKDYIDLYYLEWKWIDSDHDTVAGAAKNAKYTLKVVVSSNETTDGSGGGSGGGSDGGSILNPYTGDKTIIYIEICLGSAIAILLLVLLKRKKDENIKYN